jgi:hypothetical protein
MAFAFFNTETEKKFFSYRKPWAKVPACENGSGKFGWPQPATRECVASMGCENAAAL